jgi:hypothetical protein
MATVVKHISDLLHFHDCVIVPGLGGFVANYRAAAINDGQNLFLPPAKEIGFNRSLSHNDGLLNDHISRGEGVSYAEAVLLVCKFVEETKQHILGGQSVSLGEIGSLKGDAIGNLLFSPADTNSFLPDAYGLTSFRFEPVDYKHVAKIEPHVDVKRLWRSRSPRYWSSVAAMITGLLLVSTIELKMPEASNASFVSSFNLSSDKNIDSSVVVIEDDVVNEEVIKIVEEVPVEVIFVIPEKEFHVIGASLPKLDSANEVLLSFVKKGFDNASIIDGGKSRYRIALESYTNREEAVLAMERLRKNAEFSTVWVFSSK